MLFFCVCKNISFKLGKSTVCFYVIFSLCVSWCSFEMLMKGDAKVETDLVTAGLEEVAGHLEGIDFGQVFESSLYIFPCFPSPASPPWAGPSV